MKISYGLYVMVATISPENMEGSVNPGALSLNNAQFVHIEDVTDHSNVTQEL